jgi:hypothetical protein
MLTRVFLAFMFVSLLSTASEARRYQSSHEATGCNVIMPCDFSYSNSGRGGMVSYRQDQGPLRSDSAASRSFNRHFGDANVAGAEAVGGRPAGCPRAFCGCGVSRRVFGRIVPELNLAANWLRFPRTSPAAGMVAADVGTCSFSSNISKAIPGWRMTPTRVGTQRGFTPVPYAAIPSSIRMLA